MPVVNAKTNTKAMKIFFMTVCPLQKSELIQPISTDVALDTGVGVSGACKPRSPGTDERRATFTSK